MKQLILIILSITLFTSCEKDDVQPILVNACFTYQLDQTNHMEAHFSNCSEYATDYLWDFGDGATSTEEEPIHIYDGDFPFYVKLIAYNESESDSLFMEVTDQILDRKPNIYIYPTDEMDLDVKLAFPKGGEVVTSVPEYNLVWHIHVDPDGLINEEFDFLFYESKHPDLYQYERGWCIAKSELKSFFQKNMSLYNFSQKEIKDFTDYWIPLLNEFDYYTIYPQTNDIIDKTVQLEFSLLPDNINRLYYGVIGTSETKKIEAPEITPFIRSGFYVVEWGVFLK